MDLVVSIEKEFDVDLESGAIISEEYVSKNTSLVANKQEKNILTKLCGRLIDGSVKCDNGVTLCGSTSNSKGVYKESLKLLTDEKLEGKKIENSAEKRLVKEKCKKTSNKKAPKPPRHPNGPLLNAADRKLIQEISEHAVLERAQIERMKGLKEMKAIKLPSATSKLYFIVFAILFCLVIVFQGMSSRTSLPVSFQGTSASKGLMDSDLVIVQYYTNTSAVDTNGLSLGSLNLVEHVAGLGSQEK